MQVKSRVAKQLQTQPLSKLENMSKISNFIELQPSVQSSNQNRNFVSASQNLLKKRTELFPWCSHEN